MLGHSFPQPGDGGVEAGALGAGDLTDVRQDELVEEAEDALVLLGDRSAWILGTRASTRLARSCA